MTGKRINHNDQSIIIITDFMERGLSIIGGVYAFRQIIIVYY